MKSNFLLFTLLILLSHSLLAKTITVSNNPNSPGQFTSIQTAIDDANTLSGDVIIVQGSGTSYGNFTVPNSKSSIKIYGAGAFPNTPSGASTRVDQIIIGANNITIAGMSCTSMVIGNSSTGSVSGARIEFNIIKDYIALDQANSTNTIIMNNRASYIAVKPSNANTLILNNVLGAFFGAYTLGTYTNFIIKNNVFRKGSDGSLVNYESAGCCDAFIGFNGSSNLVVYDNIFYGNTLGNVSNSTFSNNIFTVITSASVSANSNTNTNNVFGMTQPHSNFNGSQSNPTNYDLGTSTGATVPASDGTQVGVNGGGVTFAMRGESPMPYIRPVFNVGPVIIPSGGTLNVTANATNPNQ
jgi:hypothetical protein